MSKKKSISYSVDEELKSRIDHYAKIKGYETASAFSRIAVVQHMRRHPLRKDELSAEE